MAGPDQGVLTSAEIEEAGRNYHRRLALCSILFIVFFVFYIASAVIQTPAFGSIASISALGMPLGVLMSLMIFPVSWTIIIVFFIAWR
jgi:hypothetical protein